MEDVLTVLWGFEGKLRLTFHKVYWKDKIRSTFVIVFSKEISNLKKTETVSPMSNSYAF